MQPLSYGGLEFAEDLSMIRTGFIMNYDKESDIGYSLMADVDFYTYNLWTEICMSFYLKGKKLMERII